MTSPEIKKLSDTGLIEFIEHPVNASHPLRVEAMEELKAREFSSEGVKALAIPINEAIAYKMISLEPVSEDEVAMHESAFLSAEEIREIYLVQLEKYMQYRDQFRYDVWAHLIDPK